MATPAKKHQSNLPVIALVGRVNVGKSTLFNRLIEEHKAIVSDVPGTTRTRNEGIVVWRGKKMLIFDTGGLLFDENVPLKEEILSQTENAIKNADVIVFVADASSGVVRDDRTIVKMLRRIREIPILFAANKVDKNSQAQLLSSREWMSLGLGSPTPVSATNGRNVGDFLDQVYSMLQKSKRRPKTAEEKNEQTPMRVALIGKPNVGKSSLFNKLIGEEKVIVSPMPHTTREPHDTLIQYEHNSGKKKNLQPIVFVDTAGIRRKSMIDDASLEMSGVSKSIKTIKDSDIVLLIIDGSENLSSQDLQLGGLLERHAKSAIIVVNKWDLAKDNSDSYRNEVKRMIYSYFPHLDFAPIIFVSGLNGYRVHQIFPTLISIWNARHTSIPQPALDVFLKRVTKEHRPSRGKGTRHPEILGLRQLGVSPPVFEASVKYRTSVHPSYVRYLERKLRDQFGFSGTPIILKLTKLKR